MGKILFIFLVLISCGFLTSVYAKINIFEVEEPLFQRKWAEVIYSNTTGMKYGIDFKLADEYKYFFALVDLPMDLDLLDEVKFSSTFGLNVIAQGKDDKFLPKEYLGGAGRFAYGFSVYSEIIQANLGVFLKFQGLNAQRDEINTNPDYEIYRNYDDSQEMWLKPYLHLKLKDDMVSLKTLYSLGKNIEKPAYFSIEPELKLNMYHFIPYYNYRNILEVYEETSFSQLGLSQKFFFEKGTDMGDIYLALDIENSRINGVQSLSESMNELKNYSFKAELQGILYLGIWYNKEIGTGFGIGIQMENIKQETITIQKFGFLLKWNEIVKDPILDRSAGFSVEFFGTI